MAASSGDCEEEVEIVTDMEDETEEGASNTQLRIGEKSGDFRLFGSVIYTYQYFKKGAVPDTSICLTCEENNKKAVTDKAVQIRKDNFKTKGGNTTGKNNLLFA